MVMVVYSLIIRPHYSLFKEHMQRELLLTYNYQVKIEFYNIFFEKDVDKYFCRINFNFIFLIQNFFENFFIRVP
jgi:hypothetical protein